MIRLLTGSVKRVWALLSAVLLIVALLADASPGEPEGARLVGSNTYMLEQALIRGQGLTTDGEYLYFSGNYFLNKTDAVTGQTVKNNLLAIPPALLLKGCNHIGGISYHNGLIYAAVEDGPDYHHPHIVLYDAETLRFTGRYFALPQELHIKGVPWCAVDAAAGVIYTAEWSNAQKLNVFALEDMRLLRTVPLSQPLDRIQDAEMYADTLYLSADDANKTVYALDPANGEVRTAFVRHVSPGAEAEGMTIMSTTEGPLFYVADIGTLRINLTVRQYRLEG